MPWVHNGFGLVAAAILLLTASVASSEVLPSYSCEPSDVEAKYISSEDLGRLRLLRQDGSSAAFLDLKDDDIPIVDEALRVGPSAGFYAARLLRDLALLDAFERQAKCDTQQSCLKPDIIAGFSAERVSTSAGVSTWHALIKDWKEFRDRDASRSRACLDISKTRPSFQLPLVAENTPKPPPDEPARSEPSRNEKPPREPALPRQDDHDAACRTQISDLVAGRKIYFASGKAAVKREDRQFLTGVAARVGSCPSLRIAVVGYTDSNGSRRSNRRLSRSRAEAVARILRTDPAIGERLTISGMGESHPAKPNTTRANKAHNRRVTMQVR